MNDPKEIAEKAVSEWFAYQNKIELEFSIRAVQDFNPKVIVEIGTAHNASLASWAAATNADLIIGIDPMTIPRTPEQQASFDNLVSTYNIKMIAHRSEDPEAHEELEKLLNGRKIDFLFIDAEHQFANVVYDFYAYLKYMNNPSLIGFNDIYYSDVLYKAGTGVWTLWERLKKIYQYDEIHSHSSMGNGFIYYPTPRIDMFNEDIYV